MSIISAKDLCLEVTVPQAQILCCNDQMDSPFKIPFNAMVREHPNGSLVQRELSAKLTEGLTPPPSRLTPAHPPYTGEAFVRCVS